MHIFIFCRLLDGFDENKNLTIICATNRKEDLDSALLNRFTLTLQFDLPDESTRYDIFHLYYLLLYFLIVMQNN